MVGYSDVGSTGDLKSTSWPLWGPYSRHKLTMSNIARALWWEKAGF